MASDEDPLEKLIEQGGSEPIKIFEERNAVCPACGANKLSISEYIYHVKYFNRIVISVGGCRSCGYSFRDVRLAEVSNPSKIIINVESDEVLNLLVAKSPISSIYIPEIDVSMVPGPASLGFITTVEGLIDKFIEVASSACLNVEDSENKAKCEDALKKLLKAKEGKLKVKIVICNYDGLSKVADGSWIKETQLDGECEKLKPSWLH